MFAGLGVDFGMPDKPSFKAIPVSNNELVGYDFNSNVKIDIEINKIKNRKIDQISINNNMISLDCSR